MSGLATGRTTEQKTFTYRHHNHCDGGRELFMLMFQKVAASAGGTTAPYSELASSNMKFKQESLPRHTRVVRAAIKRV